MDYHEVSVVIRAPVGTVKSRIHRGRLRLRELLVDQRELFEG
jgi:DNA-directed RNA polymerase specialized sigma24 family protein